MPALRKRQSTLRAQLDALDAELHDAETYLQLADTLEGFLGRLADGLDQLTLEEQQRILRLVVREVLIGGDDDNVTIRHSIPAPTGPDDPSYLLRGSSHARPLRCAFLAGPPPSFLEHAGAQPLSDQAQDPLVRDPVLEELHEPVVIDRIEGRHDTLPTSTASRRRCGSCGRGIRWRAARLR